MRQTVFEFGRISSREGWLLAALVLAGLLALSWFLYRRDAAAKPKRVRYLLAGLRSVAILAAFAIFLDPRTRVETTVLRPSQALVLVDRSLSMSLADGDDSSATRSDLVAKAIHASPLLADLAKSHETTVFGFGRELTELARVPRAEGTAAALGVGELAANQTETRLGELLAEAIQRPAPGPLAGVIVFTDGRATAGGPAVAAIEAARRKKVPIHPVAVGSEVSPPNLRLAALQAPARAFAGDEIKIAASLSGVGLGPGSATVDLLLHPDQAAGEPSKIASKRVEFAGDGKPVMVEFPYTPQASGVWKVRLRTPIDPRERRTDDNAATATIEVVAQKTKVLLFAGGPSHEYRFLRNLLYREKSVELSVLLSTADDAAAQEAKTVLREFPASREDLFGYDLVVAIDADWASVPPAGREFLAEWVGTHAGGLIVLAGHVHTPRLARDETLDEIQQLYPVVLKEFFTSELDSIAGNEPRPIALTSEGESTALLRLADAPAESAEVWKQFAGFYWCYPVASAKPGASVLATWGTARLESASMSPPVFATQFFGSGRVFYVGSGEIWRLRRLGERYYDRLWIRLVRQMSQGRLLRGSGKGTLLLDAEEFDLGAKIQVQARLLDAEFRPLLATSAPLRILDPAGKESVLALEPAREAGRFSGQITAAAPGEYRIELTIPGSGESLVRRFRVRTAEREFEDPRLDRSTLEQLARETGGRVWSLSEASEIPAAIEDRTESEVLSSPPTPLWDRAWVAILVACTLSAEWWIRKRSHLA